MNKKPARFEIVTPKGYRRKSLPFFQEWVDALESGNFRQVTGTLAEPKGSKSLGYCCLGVLCRVQGRLVKDRAENEWYDQSPLFNPNDEWDGSGKNDNMRSAGDIAGSNPSYKALRNNGNSTDI